MENEQTTRTFPTPGGFVRATGTEADVCFDIALRQRKGLEKYGTTVSDNPLEARAWVQHAYEELLDGAVYLKRLLQAIDQNGHRADGGEGWCNGK
jgi:hypothetical protein